MPRFISYVSVVIDYVNLHVDIHRRKEHMHMKKKLFRSGHSNIRARTGHEDLCDERYYRAITHMVMITKILAVYRTGPEFDSTVARTRLVLLYYHYCSE